MEEEEIKKPKVVKTPIPKGSRVKIVDILNGISYVGEIVKDDSFDPDKKEVTLKIKIK